MDYVVTRSQGGQEHPGDAIQIMDTNWYQRLWITAFLVEEYTASMLSRISRFFQTMKRQGISIQGKLSEQLPETHQDGRPLGRYLKKCHRINVSMNNGGGTKTFMSFTKTKLP